MASDLPYRSRVPGEVYPGAKEADNAEICTSACILLPQGVDGRLRDALPARRPTKVGRIRDLRFVGSNPELSPTDVSLRSPAWPHIPGKFTRPSHLAFI